MGAAPDAQLDPASDEQLTLGALLRRQRELAQLTLGQLAGSVGISNAYLSQIERGLRRPSERVVSALAGGLHLSAEALESRLGREREEPSPVLVAIERDDRLTGRQRDALAETYRAYLALNAGRRPAPLPTRTRGTELSVTGGTT